MQEIWSGLGGEGTSAAATLWPLSLPAPGSSGLVMGFLFSYSLLQSRGHKT